MKYAIIIRSKNERPYLDRALEALFKQSIQDFRLYNVDSGSMDGSLELIRQYNPQVVSIQPEDYVPGKVLNQMIARSTEPIIILLNADAIPRSSDWLEKLVAPLLKDDADATMSKQIARPDARFIVAYDLKRAYTPEIVAKQPYFFSAVSCAFKRSLWEKTKFCEVGYSEDMDWRKKCQEKGGRFQFVPDSVVEHSHNYTFKEWFKRGFIEGEAEKRILNAKKTFLTQSCHCLRDMGRDFIYAISQGKLQTIPYNICYRIIWHIGNYKGSKWQNISS